MISCERGSSGNDSIPPPRLTSTRHSAHFLRHLSAMTALFKSLMSQNPRPQQPTIRQDLCEVSRSEFEASTRDVLIHLQTCGKRAKFIEKDGTVHPYCGRTCAKAQQPRCKLPGCKESGRSAFSGFCSPRHARCVVVWLAFSPRGQAHLIWVHSFRSAVQTGQSPPCNRCGKEPQVISGLCLQCNNSQGDTESRLRELKQRDPKFGSGKSWCPSRRCPGDRISDWLGCSCLAHSTGVERPREYRGAQSVRDILAKRCL